VVKGPFLGGMRQQEPEPTDVVFVQNAAAFSSTDGEITLHEVAAATVFFADRPRREVGHVASGRFIELWDEGETSFSHDPPRAVLSFLEPSGAPPDVVVVLREPRLTERELSYRVDVLDGDLPPTSGACSLFIDVLGRAISPVADAGIRSRTRPRATRGVA
jgi:hypothetical protein